MPSLSAARVGCQHFPIEPLGVLQSASLVVLESLHQPFVL